VSLISPPRIALTPSTGPATRKHLLFRWSYDYLFGSILTLVGQQLLYLVKHHKQRIFLSCLSPYSRLRVTPKFKLIPLLAKLVHIFFSLILLFNFRFHHASRFTFVVVFNVGLHMPSGILIQYESLRHDKQ
jgi:hypothetical protein